MTDLYRMYDDAGDLLYIGISENAWARMDAHRRREWWPQVQTFAIVQYETRAEAAAAERAAIKSEDPKHNIVHKPRRAEAASTSDDDYWKEHPYSFGAWKDLQLSRAPRMDEATARRVSYALFGTKTKAAS